MEHRNQQETAALANIPEVNSIFTAKLCNFEASGLTNNPHPLIWDTMTSITDIVL